MVVQDLSLGDGQAVKNGDSIELLYTGWLLQNHTTGEMFDSNHNTGKLMRLKLGAGKAIKVSCGSVPFHCYVFLTSSHFERASYCWQYKHWRGHFLTIILSWNDGKASIFDRPCCNFLGGQGLEDGMLGMKKSGRRLLIIPPSLAYGSKGAANHALASSTLIFEAELCRVKSTVFYTNILFFLSSDKLTIKYLNKKNDLL